MILALHYDKYSGRLTQNKGDWHEPSSPNLGPLCLNTPLDSGHEEENFRNPFISQITITNEEYIAIKPMESGIPSS